MGVKIAEGLASKVGVTPTKVEMGLFDKLARKEDPSTSRIRRHACVFISRDGGRTIVVTMHHNQDGVLCEDQTPIVLESPSDLVLGESAFAALKATSRIVLDLRNFKASDWPAYIASGERSIREFEKDFVAVHISAANEFNLIFEIEGFPENDAELRVTSVISNSATPAALGQRIRRVFAAARDRKL
jgi:hypothetical protein